MPQTDRAAALLERQGKFPIGVSDNGELTTLESMLREERKPVKKLKQLPKQQRIEIVKGRIENDEEYSCRFMCAGKFDARGALAELEKGGAVADNLIEVEEIVIDGVLDAVSAEEPDQTDSSDQSADVRTSPPELRRQVAKSLPTVLAVDSDWGTFDLVADSRYANVYWDVADKADIVLCRGQFSKRDAVRKSARDERVVLITGSGHGDAKAFKGTDNLPVFEIGNYDEEEVRGKIIHLFSCMIGKELGHDFIEKQAAAFIGYDEDISVVDFASCGECDMKIDRALAAGETVGEAFETACHSYRKAGLKLARKAIDLDDWRRAASFLFNCNHLVCLGDRDAKIS